MEKIQEHFFADFYFKIYNKQCQINIMAYVFDINWKAVRKSSCNPSQDPKEPGRNPSLIEDIE